MNSKKQNINTDRILNSYFDQVPLEKETIILKNMIKQIDELPVLLQVWAWDGLTACSAVIPKEFLDSINNDELVSKLRKEINIDSSYTIYDAEKYTFINYAFC